MTEQRDVIGELEEGGVLTGVRWAYDVATARTLELFSEADGHDAALFGTLRFTYFRDRLDRVFACERYELQPGSEPTNQLDLLYAELSQRQIDTMPHLAPDLVRRADLKGSPGWAIGGRRFLLAACAYGEIDRLPWPRRSPTKQRVAQQYQPNPGQVSLFKGAADEEIAGLEALLAATYQLEMETFVIAHTLDLLGQNAELVFGRARLNNDGGQAWHWRHDLLAGPGDGGRRRNVSPVPPGLDAEPDARVRLRRDVSEQSTHQTGGGA